MLKFIIRLPNHKTICGESIYSYGKGFIVIPKHHPLRGKRMSIGEWSRFATRGESLNACFFREFTDKQKILAQESSFERPLEDDDFIIYIWQENLLGKPMFPTRQSLLIELKKIEFNLKKYYCDHK